VRLCIRHSPRPLWADGFVQDSGGSRCENVEVWLMRVIARVSDLSAAALAKTESNSDFFRVVIPGRECNERALMCNCTSENPFLRRVCGVMDSGFSPAGCPGMTKGCLTIESEQAASAPFSLPPCGEGQGGGGRIGTTRVNPSPQPSLTRGEGTHRRCGDIDDNCPRRALQLTAPSRRGSGETRPVRRTCSRTTTAR
jgi:hypothetical protein